MTYQKSLAYPMAIGKWIDELKAKAIQAANHAYAPYSNFHVGAAVLCEDGTIVTGCNVENASYGLTVCAERTALFSAVAQGRKPIALAVACPDASPSDPASHRMPCGACRQVMAEFLHENAPVLVEGVGRMAVHGLLPVPFKL